MDITQLSFQTQAAGIAVSRSAARHQRPESSADSMITTGEASKQRAQSKRSSIRKLGSSLFGHDRRARNSLGGSSNGGSSQLTAIPSPSPNGEEEATSDLFEAVRKSVEVDSFGRASGRTGEGTRGSQGRTRVEPGQPLGFDFEDFDTIDESPERVTASVTRRGQPRELDTERFDATDGYPSRVVANGTLGDLREYQQAETERCRVNGSANGYHHYEDQGQPQGLDTEGHVDICTQHASTTADATQYQYREAGDEQDYGYESENANNTTPRAGNAFPQRMESLRKNSRVLDYGHHHGHQGGDSLATNTTVHSDEHHHHQGDEPLHTNVTARSNGHHHHHHHRQSDGSLDANGPVGSNGYYDHQRHVSIHLIHTEADIARIAREINTETVAEVTLSLFALWINESRENYEMARRHIRQLGIDAGYTTTRIFNESLRKLLNDTEPSRPRDAHVTLAEQHAFIDEISGRSGIPMPPNTYPLMVRDEALPRPLLHGRSRVMLEAARTSSFGSTASRREYPPNTPDRPAPLSLRSPSSTTSQLTPMPTSFPRSVSSAARNARIRNLTPLHLPRNSAIFEDTANHPLLSAPAAGTGIEDIFAPVPDDAPLTAIRIEGGNAPYEQEEEDDDGSLDEYNSDGFYMEEHEYQDLNDDTGALDDAPPARRTSLTPVSAILAMFPDPPSHRVAAPVAREHVNWETLPPFERAWRELNAQLLVSLYGAKEIVLEREDVEFVDSTSRRLRAGAAPSKSEDWTRGIFLGEPSE